MNRFLALALVGLMLGAGSGTAAAQESHAGIAFKLSTLGAGVDLAVPVGEKVNVRGGFSGLSLNHDFDNDGIDLAAQLKLRSVSAHLDWFPFGGGFHLSPGVMLYNGNEVNATARVPGGETFDLGDESLLSNPANPVTGTFNVSFKKVAPSVMLGWGNIVPRGDRRWSIPFELGVVFSSSPTATLNLSGSACARNGTNCRNIATEPQLQADLREEQDQLNDDLSVLKLIPVLSFGFSFKF
jgi:hypothetical protein